MGCSQGREQCLFERQLATAAEVHGFVRGFHGSRHADCVMSKSRIAAGEDYFVRLKRCID